MREGPALLVLDGLAATNPDWDPGLLERLRSANDLMLLDNRGILMAQYQQATAEVINELLAW